MKAYVVRDSYAHEWALDKGFEVGIINAINYNLNGGTNHPENKSVFETGENFIFQMPVRNGYIFEGWYKDKKLTKKITSTEGADNNLELYAKWKLETYSITYELNGGNVTGNPTQYNASQTVKLKTPKKTGYIFEGWYISGPEGSQKVTSIAKGTYGNLVVTANWVENEYQIKFMGNGGVTAEGENSFAMSTLYSADTELAANSFTKKGYEFAGWNTKSNGKGITYNDGEKVSKLSAKNKAVITLYAMWEPEKFYITYEVNGENVTNNNPAYYTAAKDVTLKKPTRPGYTFEGWYLNENHTSKVTKLSKNLVTDITLYANWVENTYQITFNVNGGKAAAGTQTKLKDIKTTGDFALPGAEKITRDGYVLKDWNTKKDGTGTSYGLGSASFKTENLPSKNKAAFTLYAIWEAIEYPITYELNCETKVENLNPAYYTVAKNVKLLAPVRPGYTFLGWYSDAECTTKVTTIKKNTKAPVHLYAKWSDEVNVYNVNFNVNGGKGTVTKVTNVKFGDEITLPTGLTRTGYEFAGWNTKKNGTGISYQGESISNLDVKNKGTITLYAMWTAIEHTITYNNMEGATSNPNPETYSIAKNVSLKNPVKPGYTFKGWYTDDKFVSKITKISKNATTDYILYAKWEVNTYSVKFHANAGTGSVQMQKNLVYNKGITLPGADNFVREGYVLIGWNTKKNGSGDIYLLNDPLLETQGIAAKNKATVTLYAVWQPIEHSITYVYEDVQGNVISGEEVFNENPATYTIEKDIWLKSPEMAGYRFKGWYNAEGKRVILVKKAWKEDTTLIGKWEVRE